MSATTSIRITDKAREALTFLREHPAPFNLSGEASKLIIRTALEWGWRPELPRPKKRRTKRKS